MCKQKPACKLELKKRMCVNIEMMKDVFVLSQMGLILYAFYEFATYGFNPGKALDIAVLIFLSVIVIYIFNIVAEDKVKKAFPVCHRAKRGAK